MLPHDVYIRSLDEIVMNPSQTLTRRLGSSLQSALRSRLAERLTYPHGVDGYLQAVNPKWSVTNIRARIVDIHAQTDDTVTVTLRPNLNWNGFTAGQFLQLSVEVDGVLQTRCFSPANSARRGDVIELTCKVGPDSVVSRYLRDRALPGQVVTLSPAQGEFALPQNRPERVLLISGGSGITPVMSMLRTLCDENYRGRISFLHYCNDAASQLYADELSAIAAAHPNVDLIRCYAQPHQHGELEGLFSAEQLAAAVPDFADAETFLCGPPGLMQGVEDVYARAGLESRLHLERFAPAAPSLPASDSAAGEVRFVRSERLAENSGATLLDQAEAAGLRPAAGCRMGICYSCSCRKTAGQVRDLRNGQLSGDGEEDIQICVSVPVGTVALDI